MTTHHTHLWTVPDEHGTWTCIACQETAPTCIVTKPSDDEYGHPSLPAQAICNGCLRYEQGVLDDIADALGHWQHQPRSLVPAIRYDRDKTTGGRTANDRPTIQTPADVLDVLWSWADMWAELRGDTATGDVLTWLKRHLLWAANTKHMSAFDDYRSEMRQMRHHARRVAGLLPKRLSGPCVHCGGQVVQDWADENWQPRTGQRPEDRGLSDTVRCTGCDLTWQHREAWMYTNRHTIPLIPDIDPDALVSLADARTIWPEVPRKTWDKWRERDLERTAAHQARKDRGELGPSPERMPAFGQDQRGRPLYRVRDLHAHVLARRADLALRPRRTERISA